jgi:beta-phosphoglucomutase
VPRRYDAVLFDFDGVLADTEPLHCRCWQQVLGPFGINLGWETFTRIGVGHSDRDLVARLAAQRDPPIPFDELWAEYPRKKELFRKLVAETTPFPPETISLVSELSRYY